MMKKFKNYNSLFLKKEKVHANYKYRKYFMQPVKIKLML